MKQQRGENETKRDEGGPGSSHQGGGHGRAHRDRDEHAPEPGRSTNPDQSRVSGGGGERDRHHVHDPVNRS
jgi:hypothetical protein